MTSLVRRNKHHPGSADPRINALLARKPPRLVTVAMANRAARAIWAIRSVARSTGCRPSARQLPEDELIDQARYRAKRLRGPCEVMANRSDRGREQPAVTSRASKPANQNGTSSAETIKASGHDRANRPHTRLHRDQACQTLTKPLPRGSQPHRTFGKQAGTDCSARLSATAADP